MKSVNKECEFEGSPLKATLQNTNNIIFYYEETKYALKLQPTSIFWSDAFQLIQKRFLNLKTK